MRPRLLALTTLLLSAWAGSVFGQSPSLDLRGFRPSWDHTSALYTEPTTTSRQGEWNMGLWASYGHRLITLEGTGGDEAFVPLRHQLSLDYVAAIGVFDWLEIGGSVPTVLYQSGDEIPGSDLPTAAFGDPGLGAKLSLLEPGELGGVGVGLLGRGTIPVGSETGYVGEGAATGELRALGELRLIALNVQATAGVRLRAEEETFFGQDFEHDLPWGVGLSVRPQAFGLDSKGRFRWNAELRGALSLTPEFGDQQTSPLITGLSARYTVGDVSLLAGVEIALNSAVGNASLRPVVSFDWAPRFYDADDDGIEDDDDECVELAEDKDGFEDSDGCADFDNDDDGVADEDDRCPAEQEDEDEFQDDDGCPDPDNDKDGVPDSADACPNESAPATANPKTSGCIPKDTDQDGVLDSDDRCPEQAEDKDGFQDADGCPDPDNDGDRVVDEEDACPSAPGPLRSDVALSGCPNPDRDGDTYDDANDRCPDEAEDFDTVTDEDGCVDADPAYVPPARRPLVTFDETKGVLALRLPITFVAAPTGGEVDPKSLPTVRALAALANKHPEWVLLIGVRPAKDDAEAEQQALSRSFALVHLLRTLTHREQVAESVGFGAVAKQPGAQKTGLGILILKGKK